MEPEYREFREEDIDQLIDIMEDEWKYSACGEGWQVLLRLYIEHLISETDRRMAVVSGDRLLGVAMVADELERDEYAGEAEVAKAMTVPSGENGLEAYRAIVDADNELAASIDTDGRGKLVLLILSKDSKGLHIGGSLFRMATEYLASKGRRGMYWDTDSDCNVGFYDHIGAKNRGHKDLILLGYPLRRMIYTLDFD